MLCKTLKIGTLVLVGGLLVSGVLFGTEALSYVRSSAGAVQDAVKDSVPIEFELTRARDLLDEIIPEMHANVRMIAEEEVEIEALKRQIAAEQERLSDESKRVAVLREALDSPHAQLVISGKRYDRQIVRDDLARRLEQVKEASVVLASKQRVLEARHKALDGAQQMLSRTRSQKTLLEQRIAGLESQHRLVKASTVGSKISVDNSKLAQTERLLDQIKKRLDVAERVLAHESQFIATIEVNTINEQELLTEVDAYLAGKSAAAAIPAQTRVELSDRTPGSGSGR